jgi:hypothetical protein
MRFVPLEEEEKQRQAQQPKFVPLEEANKNPQGLKFVPIADMPAEPTAAPAAAAAPVITSGPNPFATPEDKGFFSRNIDWAADNLRSGWENLISGMEGLKQSEAAEYATRLEEKYGPGAVNAPPDKQQTYKEAVQIVEQAKAERQRISAQQQQRQEINPQREATRELKAAITGFDKDELSFLDSAAKAGGALLSNPVGVIADLGMESLPASLAMMSSALLVRFGGGTALASAGVGGTTSAVTEFGNEYAARIEKGIPHDEAWSDAAQKSGVIGLLDAVSMNSAGKAAGVVMDALTGTGKRLGKAAKEVAKETGKQAALGAAGEAGGSLFIGEMPNPAAVIAEAAGEVFGAPIEAVGTYRSLKPTEKPREYADTPEGRAMRGLDAIADEEEKAGKAEFDAATADGRGTPVARTLENLTEQEVTSIQRRLFAELGRPAEEPELLEAFNEYIAEQNANLGIESGASVAGVSDTGAEQSTGAAGISDTGAAATSDTGGLGASGVSTDQLTDRTTAQPSTLDEAIDAFREADDVRQSTLEELNKLRSAVEDLGYEEDQDGLNAMLTAAEARFNEASAAADAAYNTYEQFADQTIESTEGTPSQEDVEAAQPKSEEVIQETPAADIFEISTLENQERNLFNDIIEIENEQKALLTKAGRIPAKNSPARQKYDKLEEQRTAAVDVWSRTSDDLRRAKRTATQGEGQTVSEKRDVATYINDLEPYMKRYNKYINDATLGPIIQSANSAIQSLTDFVNGLGLYVDAINTGTKTPGANDAKRLMSEIAGTASRLMTKQGAVDNENKRADTEKVNEAIEELQGLIARARGFVSENRRQAPEEDVSQKPVFALPEGYAHGTDYLTSQKIIREGRLAPNAGKRMYTYSQFGRKAVYLTARNGWWLDSDKASDGRAAIYNASVPFKLDPKANIREVNSIAALDAIAREIGEVDSSAMMSKLNVENLDYEQAAREVKNLSFEQFVSREVKRRRERLQKYEAPGADTVKDIASWAAQIAAESPEFAQSEQEILASLQEQYNFLQNYEAQYKDADEVTQKLLATGIDGIYIAPDFAVTTEKERRGFDEVLDRVRQEMPDASPPEVYDTAAGEYRKANPTYFERLENSVASDQLALFRPELAIVDRARLAAARPSEPAFAAAPEGKRVDSIERFSLGPTSIKPKVVAEGQPLYRETNAGGVDDLLRNDPQFTYAPVFVTDNPDLALGQGDNVGVMVEFRPNSVSGEINPKPIPGELTGKEYKADVIAPKAIQRVTFNNVRVLNSLSGLAKRILSQNFDKKVLPDGKIEFTRKGAAGPALSPDTVGDYKKQPGETIEEFQERLVTGPRSKLAPNIVELIRNNDLTGALNAVVAKFSTGNQIRAFYGDLAARLAALNLPTEIRIGDERNLTRRSIDNITSAQQVRLFAYLRTTQPAIFDKYFKEYYKDSALELVYTGLIELNDPKYKKMLGPVENEFNDVLGAYDDFMPGMPYGALGVYYPNFDAINLNENSGLNYHTFLHEVVHAATEILLRTPANQRTPEQNKAAEELQKLYDVAKDNIKVKEYGLTNLSEFIAEVYTNSSFRNLLKGIPYAPAKTNILTRFIQSIMKLVGMDNVAGRAMVEAEKLFNVERPRGLTSAGPRFMAANKPKKPRGKGPITSGFRTNESLKERVLASRPEWKDSLDKIRDKIWDPTMAFGRGIKLGAVELRHLSDMAGTKFPLIGASVRIIEKMISHRGKIMTEAAAIAKDWMALQKKNVAKSKLLGRVMLEATLSGVEVDPLNTKYYDAAKVDQRVKDAWNALGPEFQGIYRRVRDFYQKQMQDAIQIMRDRANQLVDPEQRQKMLDNIDRDFGPDKLIYPYFPLKRFGPYWFQVGPAQKGSNYKEFYTFESMGERNTALRQRKKELLAGNSAQRNLAEKHIELGDSVSELLTQMSDASNILKTVNELIGSLPDKFSDLQLQSQETIEDTILDVQKELRDDINQLLYTLMPEQSMRKQMITRKQVQGASEDMLRVFASSATRIAYQQARAKYSPQYLANLNNARSFIKDMKGVTTPEQRRVYRDFLHEMERRYKPMLGMEDTNALEKFAGVISDAVTFFMMSAPMSAFLNTIGYFQFAATQLGGRYGYAKATEQMIKNFSTYMVSTVDRTLVPLKNGQMLSVHFPSAMESGKLTGLDKIAAQQLMDEEQVNVSQTYDMVSVGDRSSDLTLSKYEAIKRAVFMPLHQIERFNREIGLLTAFQLEYEKITSEPIRDSNGIIVRDAQGNPETYQNDATTPDGVPYSTEAYDRALTHAKDLVAITLGETTRQMRPRYFMNALLALPLKFKRYMITALYSMWSNFDKGFIEPFKTAEIEQMRKVLEANQESPDVIEQKIKDMEEFRAELSKEGRKALAGAMFNTFLVGGTAALPFYTTIFPLIIGMFIPDDDDDEFFDFDNWYRNYMENEFGGFVSGLFVAGGMDPAQARKLGRGIGEAAVVGPATKLTGGSLSDRVSLDIKSMAFRDMRYTPSARDATLEALAMALGPAAGLGLTAAEVKDLWEQKQYGRAFERGLPAILGKPVTATRYALEGAKTKRGDTLVEDVTTTEIAMQAIGLAPYRVTKAQKQAIQAVQKVQKIEHRRTNIMNDMWMSHSRGDAEGFEAAYRKGLEFSAKYPTYEITDKMISSSFKNREEQQFIANEIGARVQMKDLPIVLPMINKE